MGDLKGLHMYAAQYFKSNGVGKICFSLVILLHVAFFFFMKGANKSLAIVDL